MYNVMLVDDEALIVEGLTKVIPWEELGFRISGTASNGNQALKRLDAESVDLVITDVRMPFMDGISLIKAISERHPRVKTIIISGYGDFEYARQAMQFGAVGYVLKPTKHDELHAMLRKVKRQLDESNSLRESVHQALLDSKLRELILYDQTGAVEEVRRIIPFDEYGLCLIKDYCEENMSVFFGIIHEIVEKIALSSGCHLALLKNDGCVIVFLASFRGMCDTRKYAHQILELIKENGKLFSHEPHLFAAITDPFIELEQSHDHYRKLRECLQYTFQAVDGMIHAAQLPLQLNPQSHLHPHPHPHPWGSDIRSDVVNRILLAEKADVVPQMVDRFIQHVKEHRLPYHETREAARSLLEMLWNEVAGHVAGNGDQGDVLNDRVLEKIFTFDRLSSYLNHNMGNMFRLLQEHHIHYFTRMLHLVRKYVDEHYQENIKLEDVVKSVSLSTSYFCYVFKKETGMTFMDYLIGYRLEKAKRLLQETDMKIYEVAEQVGYFDVRHFMKQFKRKYGLKPGEFRKGIRDYSADSSRA